MIATAGVRTTAGSRLLAENVPSEDAPAVARMREAGAILIGKTNCPEFALGPRTENDLFGRTVNPHDPALVAGGSSGGCTAAVATGCTPLSLGSDFGGSLRWPAHCCGGAGMRPTPGTVPAGGQVPPPPEGPWGALSVIGPVAGNAQDLRLALEAMSRPLGGSVPARCLWSRTEGTFPVDADAAGAVERAAVALDASGLTVEERLPRGFERAEDLFSRWRATDDLGDLRALGAGRDDEFSPYIRWLLDATQAAQPDPSAAREAGELGQQVSRELAGAVLLLPVALTAAFPHETLELEVGGRRIEVNAMKVLAPCRAVSGLRLPAAAVPAGRSASGLPVGVQVVGSRGSEGIVLATAEAIERELGGSGDVSASA